MASYKAGLDPPPRPRDDSRSKRYATYTPETSKTKRSSWSLGQGYAEQAEALAYNVPINREAQAATPVYPRRDDSLSKVPLSSHFGFHRTPKEPKQPPAREPSPSKKKHTRNVLRRKPSSISQHASNSRPYLGSGSSPPPAWSNGSIAQYGNPPSSMNSMIVEVGQDNDTIIPELDRYRNYPVNPRTSKEKLASEIPHKISTQDLPPPTPLYSGSGQSGQSGYSRYSGYSASPSTQFSESSGPASYSRNTTPTSMSSQSPGIMVPAKNATRMVYNSPSRTRPPVTRRRTENDPDTSIIEPQGLPSVRESLTSSSSSSTVKDNEKGKEKKKKKRLSPPPPSPPPRKSSQKLTKAPPKEDKFSSGRVLPPILGVGDDLAALQYAVDAHTQGRSKTAPPMRPSREGTPDLSAQMAQLGESMGFYHNNSLFGISSPVERSSNLTTAHVSRSETSTPLNANPSVRPEFHSRIPSRGYSPNPMNQKTRDATQAPSGLGIIPNLKPRDDAHSGTRMRTPSPGSRRFGLFGRRTVTEPTPVTVPDKKLPRRGPQAGTGHEGYGRHAIRGRSTTSNVLLTSHDRSISAARSPLDGSNKAVQDPFLLQRMSPVIIAGGGEIMENQNLSPQLSRTESATSLTGLPRPSIESKASVTHPLSPQANLSVSKEETSRATLWPSALPRHSGSKPPAAYPFPSVGRDGKTRRPSDSSENDAKVSLAVRRSSQRLKESSPLQPPRPINVTSRGQSPGLSSYDASVTSLMSFDDAPPENVGGLRRVAKSKVLEKPAKRPRSPRKQKWNFFQRAQAGKPEPEVFVPVVAEPASKAVAHYAMMAMEEQEALENAIGLEDIMREVAEAETTQVSMDSLGFSNYPATLRRQESIHQPVLNKYESPLDLRADVEKTKAQLEPQETAVMKVASRPRLQQVGRIPPVVTARPPKMSPISFSRPFARSSMIQSLGTPDPRSLALEPERLLNAEPTFITQTGEEIGAGIGDPSSSEGSDQLQQILGPGPDDFLRFSQRKNSAVTTTSTSSFSGLLTTTESITAIIPDSQDPLKEDEVWDEYDDFDEGDETVKIRVSTTSSHGVPFMYENYESRSASRSKGKESERVPLMMDSSMMMPGDEPRKSTTSSEFNPEAFISGYRDRNNSIVSTEVDLKRRSSTSTHTRRKSGPPPLSMHKKSASFGSHSRHSSDSKLLVITEKSPRLSPLAQVNLRLGSMTVSKWLTFGHVLFSPIREVITHTPVESSAKQLRILVIDGLGNDDWSFYAAEAYSNVTFYNLSPSPSRSPSSPNPRKGTASHITTPENHRQIQHLSLAERFPFPGNMFNACILRFPRAASEATYKSVTAEAKRVLKPGGWLEYNVLDLEMGNMGNRTRRAVRNLKVRMQVADPAVHLQSSAEMLEWMISSKGFTELKSCRVGVPVASSVASPDSSPSKSQSDAAFPPSPKNRNTQKAIEEEKSLADLMRENSPSSDAGIAKMVARVGRWWYTQCFESLILARDEAGDPGNESIWNDEILLQECAKWNTSFSLLVGYARKPVSGDWRFRI